MSTIMSNLSRIRLLASCPCHRHLKTKLNQQIIFSTSHDVISKKNFHTTRPTQAAEFLALCGSGYALNHFWLTWPWYAKLAINLQFPLIGYLMVKYQLKRYNYDPVTRRKRFISSNIGASTIGKNISTVEGKKVEEINRLINQVIKSLSSIKIDGQPLDKISDATNKKWKVLITKETKDWTDFVESGQILIAEPLLKDLNRNETIALLSTQVSHILCRHYSDHESFMQAIDYYSSVIFSAFVLNFGVVVHSIPVDLLLIFLINLGIKTAVQTRHVMKLLLEADTLALEIASKNGASAQDMKSFLIKFKIVYSQTFALYQRIGQKHFYDLRIKQLDLQNKVN